jgi:DMSO/TMAO reductase YedYZ molybdopterin-dependent catalytic subunit
MNKRIKFNDIILLIFAVIMVVGLSYYFYTVYNRTRGMRHLDVVEINNYEGKDLSSINDFRENSIKGPQYINRENYKLEVKGLVENSKSFSYNDIVNNFASHKKVVTLNCVEGWSVTILWEGILLRDLFNQAKPTDQANTVIFRAYDGYSTSFPLSYFYDNDILMAYKMNDAVLPPERGFPFQLVAESKWGYKWIKWITEIEFSSDQNFEGYWEKRGYSDIGDLDKPFLD